MFEQDESIKLICLTLLFAFLSFVSIYFSFWCLFKSTRNEVISKLQIQNRLPLAKLSKHSNSESFNNLIE